LIEWQKKYGKRGFVVIAFSNMPADVQRTVGKQLGVNYILAQWDKSKLPKPVSLVMGYPTNMLIDRQGRLRTVVMGPMLEQLEKELAAALKEKPANQQKTPPARRTKVMQ
jgi:hypothetical protein